MKKENGAVKDRINSDIRYLLSRKKKKDYYKPVWVGSFWSKNYIEYENNGDRNKKLSLEEYLNKIRRYLKDILNDLKNSDPRKNQLTIAINFISSKDNDKEHVMHSKSDNKEMMINDKADKFIT